jgi:hypothetical protein
MTLQQGVSQTSAHTYLLTFTLSSITGTGPYVSYDNGYEGPFATAGTYRVFIKTIANSDTIVFDDWDGAMSDAYTIDNVSYKEYTTGPQPVVANVANGLGSLILLDGLHNAAVGSGAFGSNSVGGYGVAVGFDALRLSNADENTAVGALALRSTTSGFENTAVGSSAGFGTITGKQNVAVGSNALLINGGNSGGGESNGNVAVGVSSLFNNNVGSINAALGTNALKNISGGVGNVGLGYNAGNAANGGDGNVFIGENSGPSGSGSVSNKLYIANAGGTPLIGGDFSTPSIDLNGVTTVPSLKTASNCSDSAGAAACGSAPSGSFVIDAGSNTTVVSTTAVTANSQIFLQIDASLGSRLSVTCNTGTGLALGAPRVTARTAGTSFTAGIDIVGGPVANPLCMSYWIVN